MPSLFQLSPERDRGQKQFIKPRDRTDVVFIIFMGMTSQYTCTDSHPYLESGCLFVSFCIVDTYLSIPATLVDERRNEKSPQGEEDKSFRRRKVVGDESRV